MLKLCSENGRNLFDLAVRGYLVIESLFFAVGK